MITGGQASQEQVFARLKFCSMVSTMCGVLGMSFCRRDNVKATWNWKRRRNYATQLFLGQFGSLRVVLGWQGGDVPWFGG